MAGKLQRMESTRARTTHAQLCKVHLFAFARVLFRALCFTRSLIPVYRSWEKILTGYLKIHGDAMLYGQLDDKKKPLKTHKGDQCLTVEEVPAFGLTQVPRNENDPQNTEQQRVTTICTSESVDIDVETLFRDHQPPITYIPFGPITPTFARVHFAKDPPSPPPSPPMDFFDSDIGNDDDFNLLDDEPPPLLCSPFPKKNPFLHVFDDDDADADKIHSNNGDSFDDTMLWEYTSSSSPLSPHYYPFNDFDDNVISHSLHGVVRAAAPAFATDQENFASNGKNLYNNFTQRRERIPAHPHFGART